MNKVRSNALWNNLTNDQLKALDRWLFEEKQSYEVVLQKAQTQLGYKGSRSSLTRYFYRRRKERAVEEFRGVGDEIGAVNGAPADPDAARKASMKLLVTRLFQQLRQSPENIKEAVSLAKLIVQNDYNELLREAKVQEFDLRREGFDLRREMKAEDQKIRREAMEFAKDKYQCDMIEAGVKALPHLQKVAEAMTDPDPARYRQRADEARDAMFGTSAEVLAKNGQEEGDAKGERINAPPEGGTPSQEEAEVKGERL